MTARKPRTIDVDRGVELGIELSRSIADHQSAAVADGARRRVLWYVLNRDGGVTFKRLAALFGISEARIIVQMREAVDEIETRRDRAQLARLRELREQLSG